MQLVVLLLVGVLLLVVAAVRNIVLHCYYLCVCVCVRVLCGMKASSNKRSEEVTVIRYSVIQQ